MDSPSFKCIPTFLKSEPHGTRWQCARCGYNRHVDRHGHFPNRIHRQCDVQRMGLGDYIGLALAKVGITKDRVDRMLATIDRWRGKPVQEQQAGCGCTVRQQTLNRWGWAWQHRMNRVGWWVRHRWTWLKSQFCQPKNPARPPHRDS